jgi:hypothetical protein
MIEEFEFESRQGQEFSLFHGVQTDFRAYSASYAMGAGSSFLGGKVAGA